MEGSVSPYANDQSNIANSPNYPGTATVTQQAQDSIQTSGSAQASLAIQPQVQKTIKADILATDNNQSQIERDEKGQFVNGNLVGLNNHNAGRPIKYTEEIQKKADNFFYACYGKKDGKQRLAFIEALALEIDINPDTLVDWANKKNNDGSLMYAAFSATYNKIFTLQKLQLMTKGSNGKGMSFNQFLLSANHGMIPAEKKIVAGANNEPIETIIRIVEEKPMPDEV